MIGNGWHVGHVDSRWKLDGHGAYLYPGDLSCTQVSRVCVPDLETAYTGQWCEGRMVRGQASRVVGGGLLDGILRWERQDIAY